MADAVRVWFAGHAMDDEDRHSSDLDRDARAVSADARADGDRVLRRPVHAPACGCPAQRVGTGGTAVPAADAGAGGDGIIFGFSPYYYYLKLNGSLCRR